MRRPSIIKLSGKEYPIICNLNVLERIQEKYGSVNNFELKLLGLVFQRNEQREIIYQENGDPVVMSVEPSIDAIKTALIEMVYEGELTRQYMGGRGIITTDSMELINNCDMPFNQLAKILHAEYKRCFKSKKH